MRPKAHLKILVASGVDKATDLIELACRGNATKCRQFLGACLVQFDALARDALDKALISLVMIDVAVRSLLFMRHHGLSPVVPAATCDYRPFP